MSFVLKFTPDLSANTAIPVIDSSGIYSATPPLNLTGYGAPNPVVANVQTATLTITTKDTAVPYVIDVFPTLPNTSDAPFTVLPTMIGYTTTIPDQILQIVYTITGILPSGNPFTYSAGCLFGMLVNANCCVNRLLAEATSDVVCKCNQTPCKCRCEKSPKIKAAQDAFILLKGLTGVNGNDGLIANRQLNKANQVLALLQGICNCN